MRLTKFAKQKQMLARISWPEDEVQEHVKANRALELGATLTVSNLQVSD